MKREEVIMIGRLFDPGFGNLDHCRSECLVGLDTIERFATDVEARTIERCAKVCEAERDYRVLALSRSTAINCAEAIRALKDEGLSPTR